MIKKDFNYCVTKFFSDYLPNQRGFSDNTIDTYKYTFIQFLEYCEQVKKIKVNKITFDLINITLINDFLLWLENERKLSISSRNQKLAAIKSFFKFVQFDEPNFLVLCLDVRNIPMKKAHKPDIGYLSVEAIKILFEQPDKKTKKGLKDLAILSLIYDSGARVSEITNLKACNLTLSSKPTVTLTGKGNKTRVIPIGKKIGEILEQYNEVYDINVKQDVYLFKNKYNESLTRQGITYILNKYIEQAKELEPSLFNITVSPHILRHSKAMHLLEKGVNIIYIRDFLGHESVVTTEMYAKANPEVKREYIEQASIDIVAVGKYSKKDKDDLIAFLKKGL